MPRIEDSSEVLFPQVALHHFVLRSTTSSPKTLNWQTFSLEAFMNHKPQDAFSYYQIAGIHGMPYRPWDEVTDRVVRFPPPTKKIRDGPLWKGYCSHGSVLFPLWHRAYLMQFEVRTLDFMNIFLTQSYSKLYSFMPQISQKIWVLSIFWTSSDSLTSIHCFLAKGQPQTASTITEFH